MSKRTGVVVALGIGLSLATIALRAQDAAAHLVWMDAAGEAQEAVRAAIHANKGADAASAASRIEDLMGRTQAYWDAKHQPEGVRMAQDARTLAKQIAASATAGELHQADATFGKMITVCSACHGLHLEGR
jgi:hypothetical protein